MPKLNVITKYNSISTFLPKIQTVSTGKELTSAKSDLPLLFKLHKIWSVDS